MDDCLFSEISKMLKKLGAPALAVSAINSLGDTLTEKEVVSFLSNLNGSFVKVTRENNFCRVFQVPPEYPSGFCFGGGIPTNFQMVDWFNPVCSDEIGGPLSEICDVPKLTSFIQKKSYAEHGGKLLVMCDFGVVFVVDCGGE